LSDNILRGNPFREVTEENRYVHRLEMEWIWEVYQRMNPISISLTNNNLQRKGQINLFLPFLEFNKNVTVNKNKHSHLVVKRMGDIDLDQYTNQIKDRIAASAAAICVMKDNKIIHEWYSGFHHFHKSARKVNEYSQFNVYSTRVTYVGLAAARL